MIPQVSQNLELLEHVKLSRVAALGTLRVATQFHTNSILTDQLLDMLANLPCMTHVTAAGVMLHKSHLYQRLQWKQLRLVGLNSTGVIVQGLQHVHLQGIRSIAIQGSIHPYQGEDSEELARQLSSHTSVRCETSPQTAGFGFLEPYTADLLSLSAKAISDSYARMALYVTGSRLNLRPAICSLPQRVTYLVLDCSDAESRGLGTDPDQHRQFGQQVARALPPHLCSIWLRTEGFGSVACAWASALVPELAACKPCIKVAVGCLSCNAASQPPESLLELASKYPDCVCTYLRCENSFKMVQLGPSFSGPQDTTLYDGSRKHQIAEFFQQVPSSWLRLFIASLPRASCMLMLKTSKWLAKRVLELEQHVKLVLGAGRELTAVQTEARRDAITELLRRRRQFHVQVQPAPWLPFPTQLAQQVTSIEVGKGEHALATCCQWGAMTALSSIQLMGDTLAEEDAAQLCNAVESGQLQQLRSLSARNIPKMPLPERLAQALGLQLVELSSRCDAVINQVNQFGSLQRLTVYSVTLSEQVMQQLCEHPTLQHLQVDVCRVMGDHSQRRCRWKTLTLWYPHLLDLPHWPLAHVPHICLLDALGWGRPIKSLDSIQAAESVIAQHAHQITCQPDSRFEVHCGFKLDHPSEGVIPLLTRMQGVDTLSLRFTASSPDVLQLVWRSLPTAINRIVFDRAKGYHWAQLWDGMPQHVVSIAFKSAAPLEIIRELPGLVRSAPVHVTCIHVYVCTEQERQFWTAEILQIKVPKHLQVQVQVYKPTA